MSGQVSVIAAMSNETELGHPPQAGGSELS